METKKTVELREEAMALSQNYEYYDMFQCTPGLVNAINGLINLDSRVEFDFCVLNFKKAEDNSLVLASSLNEDSRHSNNGREESMQLDTVSDIKYSYMAFVPKGTLPIIGSKHFKSKKHIDLTLELFGVSCAKNEGVISSAMFPYPYVQEFFYLLNKWRFETGRVTLDDEVLMNAFATVSESARVTTGGRAGR